MSIDLRKGSYFVCDIDGERFLANSNDCILHVLDKHGKELWDRAPNVNRKWFDIILTFYKQTD